MLKKTNNALVSSLDQYEFVLSDPKTTFQRQQERLKEDSQSMRAAVKIMKYLVSINSGFGNPSSTYITDKIISLNNSFSIFALIKDFAQKAMFDSSYFLPEAPYSNMLSKANISEMNSGFSKLWNKLNVSTTFEAYQNLNNYFGNELPELDSEADQKKIDTHHGG